MGRDHLFYWGKGHGGAGDFFVGASSQCSPWCKEASALSIWHCTCGLCCLCSTITRWASWAHSLCTLACTEPRITTIKHFFLRANSLSRLLQCLPLHLVQTPQILPIFKEHALSHTSAHELLCPFCRWGNCGLWTLSGLFKPTQLACGSAGIWGQVNLKP